MNKDYLLKTEGARHLYEVASSLPIIDFHNHVSVADIAADKRYESIHELWVASDPYKHRLMRICGVEERLITGDAAPRDKFRKFCEVLPYTAGNPVYDWARMELATIFGIDDLPCRENADLLFDRCGEMLASPEFSGNAILSRFPIAYQSPVASILDDLTPFDGRALAPSLRGDNLLLPTRELCDALSAATSTPVTDTASYLAAVGKRLDAFEAKGCRFADHALDAGFFEGDADGKKATMLKALGNEYARRGWTLLLHLDAKRSTSTRLAERCGPAGGYAAVGGRFPIAALCDMLNGMECDGALPDTVLFPLSLGDMAPLAVMQGSFAEDGTPSKLQLGPAWWWCDHALGIETALSSIASFGVLSQFIGMTTDSRSILSFVRHDYFRRILCAWLDRESTERDWNLPLSVTEEIVTRICYQNAIDKIEKRKG